MHLAGVLDRRGMRRLADRVRRWIPIARDRARLLGALLRRTSASSSPRAAAARSTSTTSTTSTSPRQRYEEWRKEQRARVEQLYGPLPLPERRAAERGEPRRRSERRRGRAAARGAPRRGLVRAAERGVLEVRGADRVRWLDGMLSNDVARARAGPRRARAATRCC